MELIEPLFDPDFGLYKSKILYNKKTIKVTEKFTVIQDTDDNIIVELYETSEDFYKFIQYLDEDIKNHLLKISSKWFQDNTFTSSTINNIFKQSLRLPINLSSKPILHLNKNILKLNEFHCPLFKSMIIEVELIIDGLIYDDSNCYINYFANDIDILSDP